MAIEGNLDSVPLPDILQRVSMQKKTGILTVQGEDDIVAVSFKDGQVVAADALNQTVEEGLGQVLATEGLVSPKDFSRVLAEQEAGGGKRLLSLLLEQGLLDRGQLLDALRTQTYRLLLQLLRWDQGDFKFYAGDEVAHEEGFYAISVEELLIRSLGDLGGDGRGSEELPALEIAYVRIPGGAPLKILGEHGEGPMDDPTAVWLAPEERSLVERLDGSATGEEIVRETGLGEFKVLFALHRMLRAGAVRPMAPVPAPAPAGLPELEPTLGGAPPRPASGPSPTGHAPILPSVTPPRGPVPAPVAPAPSARKDRPPAPRTASRPARIRSFPPLEPWVRAALGVAALALLVLGIVRPWALLLPFPWQTEIREGLERNQRVALYQQIDRAARAHFLLEGHYPDELAQLTHLGLLHPDSLVDPRLRPLAYTADDLSYEVLPVEGGVGLSELGNREMITGDFLLDPEFLRFPFAPERPPLVLLD